MFTPEGNFDTEGLGGKPSAQQFPESGNYAGLTSGNYDSEYYSSGINQDWFDYNLNEGSYKKKQTSKMDQYEQLGSLFTGMGRGGGGGGGSMSRTPEQSLNLGGGGSLTSGFNNDWLSQSLAAGSANGAKI